MDWFTNYQLPGMPPTGECPCLPADETANQCSDDSSDFVVRVRQAPGATPSCDSYRIEISNGKYPAPP